MIDQTAMVKEDLWDPLHALVARLKNTEYAGTGSSYFDHTNIVLTSEFGRTIGGPWRADEKAAATAAWMTLA